MALGFEKLVNFNPFAGSGLLSIDFGSQQLKVLQFSASEPAQLIAAACVQTPPELAGDAAKRLEFQCSQLPAVIRNGGFKARRGVCAIPSSQMFCKHTQVLIDEGQTAKDAATIVASEQLGVDASQLAVRAVEIEGAHTAGGKREIVALATAQSLVERIMIAMRDAKVECVGLQSEFQAILSGFRPVNRRTQDTNITSLYLDIGAGSTKIVIGHGTKLAFAKAIGIGGRFFDQVAAQQARCTLPEGRAIRLGLNSLTRRRRAPLDADQRDRRPGRHRRGDEPRRHRPRDQARLSRRRDRGAGPGQPRRQRLDRPDRRAPRSDRRDQTSRSATTSSSSRSQDRPPDLRRRRGRHAALCSTSPAPSPSRARQRPAGPRRPHRLGAVRGRPTSRNRSPAGPCRWVSCSPRLMSDRSCKD